MEYLEFLKSTIMVHISHIHLRQWTVFHTPSSGAPDLTVYYNISSDCVVQNWLSVYIDFNGRLKCHLKRVNYNNTRLWLGYFSILVLNLKYV